MSLGNNKAIFEGSHPAVIWAERAQLSPLQIDCITALILKILDHKCDMNLEQQLALIAIYRAVCTYKGTLFDAEVHQTIEHALQVSDERVSRQIHQYRLDAESIIPTPAMSYFKQYLREALLGFNQTD